MQSFVDVLLHHRCNPLLCFTFVLLCDEVGPQKNLNSIDFQVKLHFWDLGTI